MKLILIAPSKVIISKTGNSRKRKMGIFECPVCLQHHTIDYSNGIKSTACSHKCRIDGEGNGCVTHGMRDTALYSCWNNIKSRCNNSRNNAYKYYGALGICYPDKWETFKGFYADMGPTYKEGLSIDRKNKYLSYSKGNCQWITVAKNRIKDKIKSVTQHDLLGNFIGSYSSVAEAGRQTGLRKEGIARAARGEREKAYGFIWEYI